MITTAHPQPLANNPPGWADLCQRLPYVAAMIDREFVASDLARAAVASWVFHRDSTVLDQQLGAALAKARSEEMAKYQP